MDAAMHCIAVVSSSMIPINGITMINIDLCESSDDQRVMVDMHNIWFP